VDSTRPLLAIGHFSERLIEVLARHFVVIRVPESGSSQACVPLFFFLLLLLGWITGLQLATFLRALSTGLSGRSCALCSSADAAKRDSQLPMSSALRS